MAKAQKFRASKQAYVSTNKLSLAGFETPFSCSLRKDNRWVVWAHKIPWDSLVGVYKRQMGNDQTGAGSFNPRVALGALYAETASIKSWGFLFVVWWINLFDYLTF